MAVGPARSAICDREPVWRQQHIATADVVRALADGCTLLTVSDVNAYNATLFDKLNFNFIRDVAPVASIASVPFVMVPHK